MTDYGFIRVSTGSQDTQTQRRDILCASPTAVIVTTDTKAASASKGEQVDALTMLNGWGYGRWSGRRDRRMPVL